MSEIKEMNIYEKLSCIQNELDVPKNQNNSFGNYKFRSCEDIMEKAKPICKEYRTTLKVGDEIVLIGNRYYVVSTAELYDWDSDKVIINVAGAREEETKKGMDSSQITGASSSYARKYALNGLFNIDDVKDSDNTNKRGKDNNAPEKILLSGVVLDNIKTLLMKLEDEVDIKALLSHYKVNSLEELSVTDGNNCYQLLKKKNKSLEDKNGIKN